MELFILAFFVLILAAGAFEWTVDSRDYADWRASDDGWRRSPSGT